MAWKIFGWFGEMVASEIHKTKITEFEKRILEIEKKQEVILKSIQDNSKAIEKLDSKVYKATLESAKAIGAIETARQMMTSNKQ